MGAELVLAAPEQMQLASVGDQMASVELWAETCDSVPELQDAANQLAAIELYLERTSKQGMARVAAASRRLEMRIGDLLGPPGAHGGDRTEASPRADLPRQRAAEFREEAANPDVVERVIAGSTDEAPASRRAVTKAIREQRSSTPFSADPEVALIERRRELSARVNKLERAWQLIFESHPHADFDDQHAHALRVLGAALIRFAETGRPDGKRADGTVAPLEEPIEATARLTDGQVQVLDTLATILEEKAKDHASPPAACENCDEPLTAANTTLDPEYLGDVCDDCQRAAGASEVPPVDEADLDPIARFAAAVEAPESDGEQCFPCDGMGRTPDGEACEDCQGTGRQIVGEAGDARLPSPASPAAHPFEVFRQAREGLDAASEAGVRGDGLNMLVRTFTAARAGFVDWLVDVTAHHSEFSSPSAGALLLQEIAEEHAKDGEGGASARLRGALSAWATMHDKGTVPAGFVDALRLEPRPPSRTPALIRDVHVNEIVMRVRDLVTESAA